MTPKRPTGSVEMPVRNLEIAEFDARPARAAGEQQFGRAEMPVVALPIETLDCALPQLVITLRLGVGAEQAAVDLLALDVYHFMTAVSDYEKTLGGRGLLLVEQENSPDGITLWLQAVLAPEAQERLGRVVSHLQALAANGSHPADRGLSLADALRRTAASRTDRLQGAFARRPWTLECCVAV